MSEQSQIGEATPLLASLPSPAASQAIQANDAVPVSSDGYDLLETGPQLLKKISYVLLFLAAFAFCMNSWAAAISDTTMSYTNEKFYAVFSMVHTFSLIVYAPAACIVSFLCQSSRPNVLFLTAIFGLALGVHGFVASISSWAWYANIDNILPSKPVVGFVAFVEVVATLTQMLWVYVAFRHSKAVTQGGLMKTFQSFPAYLTRGLALLMLGCFIAVYSTVGYSNRAIPIVWVVFALLHVSAALYISFKGSRRSVIVLSTLYMSAVLFYSIISIGLISTYISANKTGIRSLSSGDGFGALQALISPLHGVSAVLQCVCISVFAFAGFVWNCAVWYYLRSHPEHQDITEKDIDDSTETFGSSDFQTRPMVILCIVMIVLSMAQIILGGIAHYHGGTAVWMTGITVLLWSIFALFFSRSGGRSEIQGANAIISGAVNWIALFWSAVVTARSSYFHADTAAATVTNLITVIVLSVWLLLAMIWFYHARSDKHKPFQHVVLPAVAAQFAVMSLIFLIWTCVASSTIALANPAGVALGLFWSCLLMMVAVYANYCIWKVKEPRFFRMGYYVSLIVAFIGFVSLGLNSQFLYSNVFINLQIVYFLTRITFLDLTLLALLLTWTHLAWKASQDEEYVYDSQGNNSQSSSASASSLAVGPGIESAPVDPDENITV